MVTTPQWRRLLDERVAMMAMLREIADSGVDQDDDRLCYVTVQINRDLWDRVLAVPEPISWPVREV